MYKITATLKSASPLVYGKVVTEPKKKNEAHEAYEQRTWQLKTHNNKEGLFIPGNALKNMFVNTARFLSETVPGKGKATFTKNFEVGLMVFDNIYLSKTLDDIEPLVMHVPSDGKTGGTKRVWKTFPLLEEWEGKTEFFIVDQLLKDNVDKVQDYLEHGGKFIGLLTFRPRQGGQYGRFEVTNFNVEELEA